jgi:Protein of unknown function (DUF3307)
MIAIPLWILGVHFLADFVCQTDWMAVNKSSRWEALTLHCLVYTAVFTLSLWVVPLMPRWTSLVFLAFTFASHFLTDAITSRITTALWKAEKRHYFFVTIGADQLIHATTLAYSAKWWLTP